MRFRLMLVGTALTATATAILAAPTTASAEPYPAGSPDITVPTATVSEGGALTVSGTGFGANEEVVIDVVYAEALRGDGGGMFTVAYIRPGLDLVGTVRRAPIATVTANAQGAWSASITLTQAGVATITATGQTTGAVQTTSVTVLSGLPQSDEGDELPITGPGLTAAFAIGTLAVVTGAVLLWLPIAVRRRRQTNTTT
jgi:hypothetical protein